jgi:HD-GYP domain-containing protein (c-di-GMP phosphodiesterase class II)
LGGWAYVSLGGAIPPVSINASIGPFLALVVIYFFVNSGAVSGVIALNEERNFSEVWIRNTWTLAIYHFVASTLSLALAWLYLRFGVAGVLAVVIPILFMRHTYAGNLQLQETHRELLELLVKNIEARDPYTSGHSQRVSELARALARGLRLSFKEVEGIGTAALLHDVGKIYEEYTPLLRKDGRLSAEERALMQTHSLRSAELVGTISSLHGLVYKCVRHHHENFDGSGYPDGLQGDQIPIGARIIMVADTVDAMTTDRPYRAAMPFERVDDELRKYAGKQFDPAVVRAFQNAPEVRALISQLVPLEAQMQKLSRERVAQLAAR